MTYTYVKKNWSTGRQKHRKKKSVFLLCGMLQALQIAQQFTATLYNEAVIQNGVQISKYK